MEIEKVQRSEAEWLELLGSKRFKVLREGALVSEKKGFWNALKADNFSEPTARCATTTLDKAVH